MPPNIFKFANWNASPLKSSPINLQKDESCGLVDKNQTLWIWSSQQLYMALYRSCFTIYNLQQQVLVFDGPNFGGAILYVIS